MFLTHAYESSLYAGTQAFSDLSQLVPQYQFRSLKLTKVLWIHGHSRYKLRVYVAGDYSVIVIDVQIESFSSTHNDITHIFHVFRDLTDSLYDYVSNGIGHENIHDFFKILFAVCVVYTSPELTKISLKISVVIFFQFTILEK